MNDWSMHDDDPREEDLDAECAAEMAREAEQERLYAEGRQRF